MTEPFNPYQWLGVSRDASPEVVEKAWRERCKLDHPDTTTGSPERFSKTQLAGDTLRDPDARATYDRTGAIAGGTPDNTHVKINTVMLDALMRACQMVEQYGGKVLQTDLVVYAQDTIQGDINKMQEAQKGPQRIVNTISKIVGRLGHDGGEETLLHQSLRGQARDMQEKIDKLGTEVAVYERALEELDHYTFEADEPESDPFTEIRFVPPFRGFNTGGLG